MDLWEKCTREDGEFAREIFAGAARSQSSNPILNNVKAVVRLGRNLRTISLNSCVPGYLDISQFSAAPREQLSLDCEKQQLIDASLPTQISLLSASATSTS
jgi:hypothetical protein